MNNDELIKNLLSVTEKLHEKNLLSKKVGPDYFEPGMMEYLEQYEGIYDESRKELLLRFESKGTRYSGRTEQIEKIKAGDPIQIIRDHDNQYNSNNFMILTMSGKDIGTVPADLCNAMAPLYDSSALVFQAACVSFVDPISKRSCHAKQAILFVELRCKMME